ncbi:hypothetical protein [Pseudomonas sp. SO81]|uniref:hypothetical protein n=1 Tax=Pseudomonas sp. SO81 TaxID=2983246 RepID=UPI0025A497A9|nr:hypothetical protein [Pseudomonas sp. SO81]WJN61360.1 hypothetical protein OH686_21665 [Pseudomonas sp. SO81]
MKGKPAVDDEWQIEEDMRTLLRAKEIQRDPKRMAAVRKLAQKKMADIKNLTDK